MLQFIVTIKLARNPKHDPHNKVVDVCPIPGNDEGVCTDSTGEHHSFLTIGWTADEVRLKWSDHYHVTRVELATWRM